MKKIIFILYLIFNYNTFVQADTNVKTILEGNIDAKVSIVVYESLTCSHCATFHTDV